MPPPRRASLTHDSAVSVMSNPFVVETWVEVYAAMLLRWIGGSVAEFCPDFNSEMSVRSPGKRFATILLSLSSLNPRQFSASQELLFWPEPNPPPVSLNNSAPHKINRTICNTKKRPLLRLGTRYPIPMRLLRVRRFAECCSHNLPALS